MAKRTEPTREIPPSELPLSHLPLVAGAARHQLLTEGPRDPCLHALFEAQVARTPEAVAVVHEGTALTYRELNRRANQLAHHLRHLGVGPEVLVGICVERSLTMVVGLLGILKAGGAYAPLDPTYPPGRLALMLEDAQVPVLLTQQRLVEDLPEHRARVVCLDAHAEGIAQESEGDPSSGVTAENLAYVIYTSGSTGRPNGVAVSHRSVVHLLEVTRPLFQFDERDAWTVFHSYAFDFSVWEIWGCLLAGGRLVVVPLRLTQSPTAFYELLRSERVTVLNQTPSALRQLLHARAEAASAANNWRLRLIICGGEGFPPELARRVLAWDIPVWNFYGPTEATVWAAFHPVTALDAEKGVIPIGRPIADTQIYLLDPHGQPVPVGVPGELHIGGIGLARGYLNRPERTAQKFLPHPCGDEPGARLYKTGDLARYLPDGNIEFLGRMDHQVKLRGFRIELGEIEAVLGQHPAVRECVVMARQDVPHDQRLVAYVVAHPEQVPTTRQLRCWLREKLPEYMLPSVFVMLAALPLTSNGKVDRQALPAPDPAGPELERTFQAPRDMLELQLTKIWEKVFGIRPIGVTANFFDLGGDSLQAAHLLAEVEESCGRTLPLGTLLHAPTVEQLARILRQEGWSPSWSSLVALQPGGSKPPFFCVHGAGGHVLAYRDLAQYLGSDQPVYGLRAAGLAGKQTGHTRIEDMAAHNIKEMRLLQPEGPYYLGGASFGGTVAYEMAHQLHAQGQKVGLLALFDTSAYDTRALDPMLKLRTRYHLGILKGLGGKEKLIYVLARARAVEERIKTRIWAIIRKVCPGFECRLLRAHAVVARVHLQAERDYVPPVYPGRVTLFRAKEQHSFSHHTAHLGWEGLAAGGVEIHEVPGEHTSLLHEPHVQTLAEQLRACLHRCYN